MDVLKVMSYNIRNMNDDSGDNAWEMRRGPLADRILVRDPDVLCIQEAFYPQVSYIAERMPAYQYIGVGREDGVQKGEFAAVFFKKDKFELVEEHHLWLSETPDVPSKGWDGDHYRICSWARLRDRQDGAEYVFGSTHFDHAGPQARFGASRLIRETFTPIAEHTQCFIMGDLNLSDHDEAFILLNQPPFYDARQNAVEYSPHNSNHKGFDPVGVNFSHTPIDHLLYTPGAWRPELAEILITKRAGRFPSDHFPVLFTFFRD